MISRSNQSTMTLKTLVSSNVLASILVLLLGFVLLFEHSAFAGSLSTNVDELNFGSIQINSSTDRTLTFTIENTARRSNNLRDVNIGNVSTEARIHSNCNVFTVSPSRVDIPIGGTANVEVRLRNVSTPGPLLCSVTIDSSETFSTTTSSRSNRNSCGGISSARICVELKANVTASSLTLVDFEVDRTSRSGSRSNNDNTVNITQTGSSSNATLTADFGSLDVFEQAEATVTIGNTGDATLQVNVRGSGNNNVSFRGALGDNVTIQPGDEREIQVFIRSVDGGPFTATLTITPTGRGNSSSQRITIRFTGNSNSVDVVASKTFVTFEARVNSQASTGSITAQTAEESPGTGSIVIAQQSNTTDEETLTIRNEGEGDDRSEVVVTLSLEHIRFTGGGSRSRSNRDVFRFEGTDEDDELEFSLNSGRSQSVTIIYEPSAAGIDEGVIEVEVRLIDSSSRSRSGQVIQSFFINLRGIAIASNTSASAVGSAQEQFMLSQTKLQQVTSNEFRFEAQGSGINAMQAEVFSLAGSKIYDSGFIHGDTVRWNMAAAGTTVANGVYFYRLIVRGNDGSTKETQIRKFVLMR